MITKNKLSNFGIMSGTSLDGIDLAICSFIKISKLDNLKLKTKTISYSEKWKEKLKIYIQKVMKILKAN